MENFRDKNEYSRQEELLRQYQLLSSSDHRRSRRFWDSLTELEQCQLEKNAHYDGDAFRFRWENTSEPFSIWDVTSTEDIIPTYGEEMLGYFNLLAQKARRFSPAQTHQHDFVELYYVVKGICTDVICSKSLSLVPGDLVIIQPNTLHQLSVPSTCVIYQAGIKKRTFHSVCGELLSEHMERSVLRDKLDVEENDFLLFRTGVEPELLAVMEQMLAECEHPHKYFNIMLQGHLTTLLALLLNSEEPDPLCLPETSCNTFDEKRLLDYLHFHLSEVTLQSAADHFGFSVSYFSTLVRETMGQNFSKLLRREKLATAAALLTETDYTVRKICEETGYESVSQFSGTFKREYGISPGEYRKKK
ncbi:MAG: AraC family transcriptional regulator [Oscillospiraceae bacterium]|nr:AraC family transcriptional regulator [Oscillospiraceae bacterium]